mgnify:CR=1 FL=1
MPFNLERLPKTLQYVVFKHTTTRRDKYYQHQHQHQHHHRTYKHVHAREKNRCKYTHKHTRTFMTPGWSRLGTFRPSGCKMNGLERRNGRGMCATGAPSHSTRERVFGSGKEISNSVELSEALSHNHGTSCTCRKQDRESDNTHTQNRFKHTHKFNTQVC